MNADKFDISTCIGSRYGFGVFLYFDGDTVDDREIHKLPAQFCKRIALDASVVRQIVIRQHNHRDTTIIVVTKLNAFRNIY